LGKKRIIREKIGLFGKKSDYSGKNRIIWEKIGLFGKKSDYLGKIGLFGKYPIFWEIIRWKKNRFFDYAIIFFSSDFPLAAQYDI
jgi:hypothetical protein